MSQTSKQEVFEKLQIQKRKRIRVKKKINHIFKHHILEEAEVDAG
jgi:hypothetical protein